MMTVIMTNTYVLNEDEFGLPGIANVITGILGAYDDMDKATKAWNEALKKIGVPEERVDLYDTIGHAYIRLNESGKYIPDDSEEEDDVYRLELMSKILKPNVTYWAAS